MARARPFAAALHSCHRDTGNYPKRLADLYPHYYLGTNVLWYHNADPQHSWILSYEKRSRNDYRLYLDSRPCSQAMIENGKFIEGCGPNYARNAGLVKQGTTAP